MKIEEWVKKINPTLPRGVNVILKKRKGIVVNNNLFLKFPYERKDGSKKYREVSVCPIPITRKQKKEAREMIQDIADFKQKEFWESDKLGIEPKSRKPKKPTFEYIALDYCEEKGIETSPKYIRDCVRKFGDRIADDIYPDEIEKFYMSLFKQKAKLYLPHKDELKSLRSTLSYDSVVSRKIAMVNIYKAAKKKGLVKRNPALEAEIDTEEVKRLGKSKQPRQKSIPYNDFLLIHEQLIRKPKRGRRSKDLPHMAMIGMLTGMRFGEIYGLEFSRVVLDHDHPHVKLEAEHVKVGPGRIVPLMPPLVAMFVNIGKVRYLKDDRVFRTKYINNTWRRAVARSWVTHPEGRIRFHDLRSSCITLMDEAGVDPVIRMKIVGHSVEELKKHGISKTHFDYLNPSLETLYDAIMQFYNYLFEKKGFERVGGF